MSAVDLMTGVVGVTVRQGVTVGHGTARCGLAQSGLANGEGFGFDKGFGIREGSVWRTGSPDGRVEKGKQ